MSYLEKTDTKVQSLLDSEIKRQKEGLELIPSENYTSGAVMEALGSIFTNKYSEGFPGKRYYGGQENTDKLESLAIDRAKKLFNADHANVQALSGAPANIAAYLAWCDLGDTIMGMDLSHGGHLTHGKPETHGAKFFRFVRYGIKDIETGEIDYDKLRDTAKKEKPKIILAGYTSFPRNFDYKAFKEIADEVGAVAMADVAHISGLIAGKVLDNPLDFGFEIMTSTTHKTLRGPRGGIILTKGKLGNPLKPVERKKENIPTLVDRSVFPGLQGGPHMNKVAAIAVALHEASTAEFAEYAQTVLDNAQALATALMQKGCKLVTNGTSNHMMLIHTVDSFGINGAIAEKVLDSIGITLNKNVIPDDPNPPYKPSGVRLGTPALTTRGMKPSDMEWLADKIVSGIKAKDDEKKLKKLRLEVTEKSLEYPVPGLE